MRRVEARESRNLSVATRLDAIAYYESRSGLNINVLLTVDAGTRMETGLWGDDNGSPSGMNDAGPGLGRPRSKGSSVFPLHAEQEVPGETSSG